MINDPTAQVENADACDRLGRFDLYLMVFGIRQDALVTHICGGAELRIDEPKRESGVKRANCCCKFKRRHFKIVIAIVSVIK